MLDILGSGADRLADDGAVEKKPDADIDEGGNPDHHQAIDRNFRPEDVDLTGDRLRHRARHQPPKKLDDADAADQHGKRRDHGEGQVAVVDAPEHHAFYQQGREARDDHAGQYAEPDVSGRQADRVGDIGADRVVKQLVKADDAHQAETKRQADRHQEKDAAQAQAENNARGQQLHADQRLERAPDALLAGEHDEHEHEADHQLPITEGLAEHVLHAGIDDRADDGPVQRADPAEDRHHHRIGGARRAGDLRADEAEIDGIHRPGQSGGR